MKNLKKISGIVMILLVLSLVLQSCVARKSQYGCPERISTPSAPTV